MNEIPELKGKFPEEVHETSQALKRLNDLLNSLLETLDRQIEAVIQSRSEQLSELTEIYSDLQSEYGKCEKDFIEKLKFCSKQTDNSDSSLRLSNLKDQYPELEPWIDGIRTIINEKVKGLTGKQNQLVSILGFALERNRSLMHSIYNMYNQKNTVYSARGDSMQVSSGVAINEEV